MQWPKLYVMPSVALAGSGPQIQLAATKVVAAGLVLLLTFI
jgi:hypothetical protein